MAYTPMGGSPTINVLFYTHVGGSPVTLAIGLQHCIWFPNILVIFYTPVSGSPIYNVLVYTPVGC